MKIDLSGRTAIVTGSTRGIGRAIADALAGAGARVAVVGRDQAKAAEAAAAVAPTAHGFAADVGDRRAGVEVQVNLPKAELGHNGVPF